MPDAAAIRPLLLVSAASLAVRLASAFVVTQPGFTDAYYYSAVAGRLAHGGGLTADFVWNFIEASGFAPLPVASHRFWVPLATAIQAVGIGTLGPLIGDFRAAQAPIIAFAAFLPALTYAAARSLGVSSRFALAAAAIVGAGGLFAWAWVSLDSYAPAAVIGTLFFLAFARAARASDVSAGAAAGLLVGLLYLARVEGALFGLALLALLTKPGARRPAAVGAALALCIGTVWFVRDIQLGAGELLARTALLVRYEDFFRIAPPSASAFIAALPEVLLAKAGALVTNATTAVLAFALLLGPLAALAAWRLRGRPEVRAWSGLLVLVFVAQSLLWTLHSTHGSYVHSLAAFFPFGVALAAAAGERALATREEAVSRMWVGAALALVLAISGYVLMQWEEMYAGPARARAAALVDIPAGPFLAIDAAAWRSISGRSVIVTPADGLAEAACAVAKYGARSVVLERTHFSAYDALYRGEVPGWLDAPPSSGDIRVYRVRGDVGCSVRP